MGKQKICSKCTTEILDSRKQKLERSSIIKMLKMIKVAGISEKHKETKDLCFDCWKKDLRAMMKPYAQALGKNAEEW